MIGRVLAGLGAAAAVALAPPAAGVARVSHWRGDLQVHTHKVAYGQAPVFMPDGRVVFGQDYKQGAHNQVYRQNWDGSGLTCLTCKGDPVANDPNDVNGVPAVRPQGDWVLFHSWRGHYITIGSAGYGGVGSSLWVMRPDGSDQTQVTDVQPSSAPQFNGEGIDDYHAYWSPDGKQIVYAHLNGNFVSGAGQDSGPGQGKWDVRVADFVVQNGKPTLTNIREVRPFNGHWYETQWWNPDRNHPGFLYTETYPEGRSGGGASVPQLFYCRLVANAAGKPESACKVTRLTDNASWDEQAVFVPGTDKVIFMSSRARDGFFNTWANLTRTLGLPSDYDYLLILPIFEAGFLQPVAQESTQLYMTSLDHPSSVRQLTADGSNPNDPSNDGWITPEFGWDPSHRCLVWTENRLPDGYRYQLPVTDWAQQAADLAANPPNPSDIIDVNQNGVGVAPFPVQQRTQVGSFSGSGCTL
jgi:Tol biopolymer transport system component